MIPLKKNNMKINELARRGEYIPPIIDGVASLIPVCYYIALKNNLEVDEIWEYISFLELYDDKNDVVIDMCPKDDWNIHEYFWMIDKEYPLKTTKFHVLW